VSILFLSLISYHTSFAQWPMSYDTEYDISVSDPAFKANEGPKILLDVAHHNFMV
jgi:hypothetical protein